MIFCDKNSEQPLLQFILPNALKNMIAILIGFQYLHIYLNKWNLLAFNALTYFIYLMK